MEKISTQKKIERLLKKGVAEIIDEKSLYKKLISGKKLRVKFGIDPTSPNLHLGHSIALRKLRDFQELGHQVIFLIGDFTAKIGDPSGRKTTRKPLTDEEIKKNMKDYVKQAGKILDMKKVKVHYNSEWYKGKDMEFLMTLASYFTVSRLLERDDFQKRLKENIDITLLETIYPLLQGYDSVALKADVEIGGTDQKFNLLVGRKMQRKFNQNEQDIITVPLLEGTDGKRKMSKSYGNYIAFKDSPLEMFGKIMSIPDALLWKYFELLTDVPEEQIEELKKLASKNPVYLMEAKKRLAREIVAMYHNKKSSITAEKEFEKIFSKKELPSKIPEVKIKEKNLPILDLLVKTKLVPSKSEAKRLVLQRGVKIDGKIQDDWRKNIEIKKGMVLKIGKRKFVKIV